MAVALVPPKGVNFDASSKIFFERIPTIGKLYHKNSFRFGSAVRHGDIVRGLPIANNSVDGLFASHVLERLAHHFGNRTHRWMWDEASMLAALQAAGFSQVRRCEFGDSGDPMFRLVEQKDRFQTDEFTELALEAIRYGELAKNHGNGKDHGCVTRQWVYFVSSHSGTVETSSATMSPARWQICSV
jgi:hypothetical protein